MKEKGGGGGAEVETRLAATNKQTVHVDLISVNIHCWVRLKHRENFEKQNQQNLT